MSAVKNPKTKGGSFERELSKLLSLWWTENERDDVIWRSQSSGGRATQRASKGKETTNAYGDLSYTDEIAKPLFDIVVAELKRGYNKTNLLDLIDSGSNCEFLTLWNQVVRDSILANRNPLLILKRDRRDAVVFLLKTMFNQIIDYHSYPNTRTISIHLDTGCDIIGLRMNDFLSWCSPETLKRIAHEKESKAQKV